MYVFCAPQLFSALILSSRPGTHAVSATEWRECPAAPVVMVAQERVKKEKSVDELKPVEPADEAKGSKKAKTTLCKWGWSGSDVEAALVATASATASAVEQGQAAFNKQRQVTALDWLLLNAPENSVQVDYRNDAMKARS
jgi:hypothetical protein